MFKNKYLCNSITLRMIASAVMLIGAAHAQPCKPTKTVKLVVSSAPGSSPDVIARVVQKYFHRSGLVPSSAAVNQPGAANTIGWRM